MPWLNNGDHDKRRVEQDHFTTDPS